jgi:hypothetical protein
MAKLARDWKCLNRVQRRGQPVSIWRDGFKYGIGIGEHIKIKKPNEKLGLFDSFAEAVHEIDRLQSTAKDRQSL